MDVNRVTMTGRLCADPELKYLESGKAVVNFRIACNQGSQENPRTVFISCEAWEKTAENVDKFLSKGSNVLIDGRLKFDQWEADDGTKRSRHSLVAGFVKFLDPKGKKETDNDDVDMSGPPGVNTDDIDNLSTEDEEKVPF